VCNFTTIAEEAIVYDWILVMEGGVLPSNLLQRMNWLLVMQQA
jgi:hypothetical protein